jgi:formate hydrogenlyase transcriptional activator
MTLDDRSGSGERRYRLLLEVAEAANSHLDLDGVLEVIATAVRPLVRVDALGLATLVGREHIRLYSIYAQEGLQRPGESIDHLVSRVLGLPPTERDDLPRFTFAGSIAEHGAQTRSTFLCADVQRDYRFAEREQLLTGGIQSVVAVPLAVRGEYLGVMTYLRLRPPAFGEDDARQLEDITKPVATSVANALAYEEIERLRQLLAQENVALREEVAERGMFRDIVGSSTGLRDVLARVEKVAPTDSTVLIQGETGTGKELIARAIHQRSRRSGGPLVCVNCAALPQALVASELFGHEKGAFTGATQRRIGRFELASGGTLFLDEVGDLPAEVQVALLRVLQEHEFVRVGGTRTLHADARVIAATHCDLREAVAEGSFREDLYYRLSVFPIDLPPLRDRREDIPALVEYFAKRHGERRGLRFAGVEPASMERLVRYAWPGNVRELENAIERTLILSDGGPLRLDERAFATEPAPGASGQRWVAPGAGRPSDLRSGIRTLERQLIEQALAECQGRVSGSHGAAQKVGIPPATLDNKIRLLGIDKHHFRSAP